jgi:uncharacterized protein YegP (UPF0339 family)
MSLWVRSLVLFLGIATLTATAGVPTAPAFQKSQDKKDKEAAVGTIEVYQAKDGWRFRIKSAEGKTLAIASSGQKTKEDCLKIVETLKTTMAQAKVDVVPTDKEKEKQKEKDPDKKDKGTDKNQGK